MIRVARFLTIALAAFAICLAVGLALAGEREITKSLAATYHATAEVVLSDGSRADLVSDRYAIEVEYAHHWKESIGQSVLYGILTDKQPGVVLLVADPDKEAKYIERCRCVCDKLQIKLWIERVKP